MFQNVQPYNDKIQRLLHPVGRDTVAEAQRLRKIVTWTTIYGDSLPLFWQVKLAFFPFLICVHIILNYKDQSQARSIRYDNEAQCRYASYTAYSDKTLLYLVAPLAIG